MGALHPEMINCFNPNGNPTFNQHVVAALCPKNMKKDGFNLSSSEVPPVPW
jgi:hypothetical protein